MHEFVESKVEDHIGHIILNRPEKLNAISREVVEDIMVELEDHSRNPDVKAIILSGNGKSFCAGGDIETMKQMTSAAEAAEWMEYVSGLTRKILDLEKYVIAAVHGYAAGAGFSLALAADFIVAEENARFAFSFSNIGLIPDLGLIKTISERLSPPLVKEWVSSGKVLTAEESIKYGLINRIAKGGVVEEAKEFAEFIVNGPGLANKYVKYLVNHVASLDKETAFMKENVIQALLLQTRDHQEGVAAFFEKRKPKFTGK
ncbi:enoyl-CoA hydratase/isomerase family protein [Fredinandcohnia humi]